MQEPFGRNRNDKKTIGKATKKLSNMVIKILLFRNHRQKITELLLNNDQLLNDEYDSIVREIGIDPKNYHCWKYL